MRWAIVIGVNAYGSEDMDLSAGVSDARDFYEWVTAPDGGGVPEAHARLLLAPAPEDAIAATKDTIVTAINEVVTAAGEEAEQLFFYFAGHGITARVSNRDESALVTPGFDALHTDHSLAVRSLAEYFETTAFADQFFFIDACRNVPWTNREFEIGRWPVPRRRDPGADPVQQFILYATSPGRKAAEQGWPGEAEGAFTSWLLQGLTGDGEAKAWSWERNCYEVRWERLATYINGQMKQWPTQIPQDAGSRGVADRDRDAIIASFPSSHFPNCELEVTLQPSRQYDQANISVLDAVGSPVAEVLALTGTKHTFRLAPKTYAVRATTTPPDELTGSLKAPVPLYANRSETVTLQPRASAGNGGQIVESVGPREMAAAGHAQPPGTLTIRSHDPLAIADITDEAGRVVEVVREGKTRTLRPGFYRVRHLGPETERDEGRFVVLAAGEDEEMILKAPAPEEYVATLAAAAGGSVEDGFVIPVAGADPVAWALPSTVLAAAVGATLAGSATLGLGGDGPFAALDEAAAGIAVLAVDHHGDRDVLDRLRVATWPAGEYVPAPGGQLERPANGVAALVQPVSAPALHWLSLTVGDAAPTVVAVPVLPGRLATVIVLLDPQRPRVFQWHPALAPDAENARRMRCTGYLERMLVAGRLDIAEPLAEELAASASVDPFGGLLAGYVLLRLGRHEPVGDLASAITAVAPHLADAYVLRGEYEGAVGNRPAAAQAFTLAINTGIPVFGGGLTKLIEGMRAHGIAHPRAAIVQHVFQRHARGSMWSAFTPRRPLTEGRAVISAADLGVEA